MGGKGSGRGDTLEVLLYGDGAGFGWGGGQGKRGVQWKRGILQSRKTNVDNQMLRQLRSRGEPLIVKMEEAIGLG
jgi:hypothetical protein